MSVWFLLVLNLTALWFLLRALRWTLDLISKHQHNRWDSYQETAAHDRGSWKRGEGTTEGALTISSPRLSGGTRRKGKVI